MTKLTFQGMGYAGVAGIYRILDTLGISAMIFPQYYGAASAFLVVDGFLMGEVRDAFSILGIKVQEKEVLFLKLSNQMGIISEIARKIASRGVSINFASLWQISATEGYLILDCNDNRQALKSLEHGNTKIGC